jgi:hypothetical protein
MKKPTRYAKTGFVSLFILIAVSACTGRMARVDESWIKGASATPPAAQKKQIPFSVAADGIEIYTGRPSTIGYMTWGVTVDLKSIQEIAARTVLSRIPDSPAEKKNSIQVQSSITDFSYKWNFPWPTKRVWVSFTLHLEARAGGRPSVTRTIEVKDLAGSETRRFLIPPEIILDKLYTKVRGFEHERSEMVAKAAMEAVYGVYNKELPLIISELNK